MRESRKRINLNASGVSCFPEGVSIPHLLVVDDDVMIRDVLSDFLTEGYQVSLARDGLEALRVTEREQNLVVLLDLTRPGLNGEGAIAGLQTAQRDDHQIVVITARQHTTLERRWLQKGVARAVAHTPLLTDRLLIAVQQAALDRPPEEPSPTQLQPSTRTDRSAE